MRWPICLMTALTICLVDAPAVAATSIERIRNEKVIVSEDTLAAGEARPLSTQRATMLVWMNDGSVQIMSETKAQATSVHKGQTLSEPAASAILLNEGTAPLHFARIEFLTAGSADTWGMTGLSPHYVMLDENRYARCYDIKIPAHTFEPQHTHHDRVVVSLSGAELEHILPDGSKQPSTLKTGEIVWRLAATHVGHNLGSSDLWVIAIEPK